MKRDRFFYTVAGAVFLVLIVIGFRHYIFEHKLFDGTPIPPVMLAAIVAHSTAIFAWFVLFFAQAVLISTRNRNVHMKLGWGGVAIAATIAVTGPYVAIRGTRLDPSGSVFDWPARPFLLVMLSEIALFVVFFTIGVLNRKRPRVHRPMMMMASLSIISGATARIPLVNSIFGLHQWMALFGPVAALGLIFFVIRWAMTRTIDREYALGYGALVVVSLAVSGLAFTDAWVNLAGMILGH